MSTVAPAASASSTSGRHPRDPPRQRARLVRHGRAGAEREVAELADREQSRADDRGAAVEGRLVEHEDHRVRRAEEQQRRHERLRPAERHGARRPRPLRAAPSARPGWRRRRRPRASASRRRPPRAPTRAGAERERAHEARARPAAGSSALREPCAPSECPHPLEPRIEWHLVASTAPRRRRSARSGRAARRAAGARAGTRGRRGRRPARRAPRARPRRSPRSWPRARRSSSAAIERSSSSGVTAITSAFGGSVRAGNDVDVLPGVAELDAGLEQRVDQAVALHEAAARLEPAEDAAEGDEPDPVAALEVAAGERRRGPHGALERPVAPRRRCGPRRSCRGRGRRRRCDPGGAR